MSLLSIIAKKYCFIAHYRLEKKMNVNQAIPQCQTEMSSLAGPHLLTVNEIPLLYYAYFNFSKELRGNFLFLFYFSCFSCFSCLRNLGSISPTFWHKAQVVILLCRLVSPTKLRPTLPLQTTRKYAQLICCTLCAVRQ
jgi:hypothetical protein